MSLSRKSFFESEVNRLTSELNAATPEEREMKFHLLQLAEIDLQHAENPHSFAHQMARLQLTSGFLQAKILKLTFSQSVEDQISLQKCEKQLREFEIAKLGVQIQHELDILSLRRPEMQPLAFEIAEAKLQIRRYELEVQKSNVKENSEGLVFARQRLLFLERQQAQPKGH
jgi:hypothetical protein